MGNGWKIINILAIAILVCTNFYFLSKSEHSGAKFRGHSGFCRCNATSKEENVEQIKPNFIRLRRAWERNSNSSKKWTQLVSQRKLNETYTPFFNYSKEPLCYGSNDENLTLLILVHSAPKNSLRRMAIRKTWGFYKILPQIRLLFFIGRSGNFRIEKRLQTENEVFNDIIRFGFKENYFKLTYKTVAMLEFVMKRCSNAKFLIKVDDDTFLNVPNALEFIQKQKNTTRSIFGQISDGVPQRYNVDKYYLNKKEFSGDSFPPYYYGGLYMITGDLVMDLYYTALDTPFFKLEDVFLTGLVRVKLGVRISKLKKFSGFFSTSNIKDINSYVGVFWKKFNMQTFHVWKMQKKDFWNF